MNVKDVMNKEPRAVSMVDRLDGVARILWEQDCGFVPVVDGANMLVGVVTDRDLCMASYTQGKTLSEVPVLAVMARELTTCSETDSIKDAMQSMVSAQVHRLPVVDARGVLLGVLAANDLVQVAMARPAALSEKLVLATIAGISKPRSGARDYAAEAKPAAKKSTPKARAAAAGEAAAKPAARAKSAAAKKPAARASKSRSTKRKA